MRHKIEMLMQEFEFHSIGSCAVTAMLLFFALFITAQSVAAEETKLELVDIKSIVPSIVVELRYAGTHNAMHRALYPPSMPALIRPKVAQQLLAAQNLLRRYGYGLKIWDAYRPKSVQRQLWQFTHDESYVANPDGDHGTDPVIRSHLKLLQRAMGRNGFYGLRTEWWHFTAQDWKNYVPYQDVQVTGQSPKTGPDGKL